MFYFHFGTPFGGFAGRVILAAFVSHALIIIAQPVSHADHRRPVAGAPAVAVPAPPPAATSATIIQPNSAFERYQRFDADTPLTDWRAANQTVQQIGGWRAYAREAAAAAATLTPPVKPIPPTLPGAPK